MPGVGREDARRRQGSDLRIAWRPGQLEYARPRNGKTRITDGHYTEPKELVGGLFIIEADSRDEAIRISSMHPAATLGEEGGWTVELMPIGFYLAL